jgi:hypothetical protein
MNPPANSRREFLRLLLAAAGACLLTPRDLLAGSRLRQTQPKPALHPQVARVVAASRRLKIPRNRWTLIVGHHSAIERGNAVIYGRAHLARGMVRGLAYHFVIGNGLDSGDGEIEIGPRWLNQQDGGHVKNEAVNATGIGICVVGNCENHPPTPKQLASFEALVRWLATSRLPNRPRLIFHEEIPHENTLCPGRCFPRANLRTHLGRAVG